MNSLADYLMSNLEQMVEITPHMEKSLNRLFEIWKANDITVEEFREKYSLPNDAGVFTILPFMTRNANNPDFININEEETSYTFFM